MTDLIDMQKEYMDKGELASMSVNGTKHEMNLSEWLIDAGIKVIPQFKINKYSFDLRLKDYPILIEVDGSAHGIKGVKIKDCKKERIAIKSGYTVLRYTNFELDHTPMNDIIDEIKFIINLKEKKRMTFIERLHNLWK